MTKRSDGTRTGRRIFACRVATETPGIVEEIAKDFGCFRVNKDHELTGACGVLLDRIAQGKLKIVSVED
jgi:hypothetical protein